MRILIDATTAVIGKSGAVGAYRNMMKFIPELDNEMEVYLLVSYTQKNYYTKFVPTQYLKRIHFLTLPNIISNFLMRIFFQNIYTPIICTLLNIDIHFSLNPEPIINKLNIIEIFKIAELQFLEAPQEFSYLKKNYRNIMTIHKIKKCKKVIANSPHTKNQIQKYFKISEDKIQIIYEAFDTDLFFVQEKKASTKQLICNTFGITYPYLLYISSFRPYKNHKLLLDAFKKVKSKKQIPHSLVLIGNDINDYKSEIERYVSKLELNDNVKFIDFIHHWDLPSVYNYADLFVYPSEYETFGIPPLESMACGTPVIASNKSCIPEICGPGAVIVDPYDSTTFSNEIFRLLSDKEHRLSLINKGLNHCKKYSWRENVAQTLQIINEFTNTIRNERYSKSN